MSEKSLVRVERKLKTINITRKQGFVSLSNANVSRKLRKVNRTGVLCPEVWTDRLKKAQRFVALFIFSVFYEVCGGRRVYTQRRGSR